MAQAGRVEIDVVADLSQLHEAIRTVEVLRPQPGDVVLLECDADLCEAEIDAIHRHFVEVTGMERVLILGGLKTKILRPDDGAE